MTEIERERKKEHNERMDIVHWVVCVDEKRVLVEQDCGVVAQVGDSSVGYGGITA